MKGAREDFKASALKSEKVPKTDLSTMSRDVKEEQKDLILYGLFLNSGTTASGAPFFSCFPQFLWNAKRFC